jgi:hypothetical protein
MMKSAVVTIHDVLKKFITFDSIPVQKLSGHILFTKVCATPVASKEASGHKLFTISLSTHCHIPISAAISMILTH